MALPVITGSYRTISDFTNVLGGKPFSLVLDFQQAGAGPYSAASVAEAVENAWRALYAATVGGTTLAAKISTAVTLNKITSYDLGTTDAPAVAANFSPAIAGTSVGIALPPDVAFTITKRTPFRGRSGRGRAYMAGFVTTAVAAGGLAGLSGMAAAWNANFLRISDDLAVEYDMVVISQAVLATGIARRVVNFTTDTNWDTQRRRGL